MSALVLDACRDEPVDLVLVGSVHHFAFFQPDNSPAHLRALLERIAPDAILVENPPEWTSDGRHFWIHLPEHSVVAAYSAEVGADVHGIDWVGEIPCFWPTSAPAPEDRAARLPSLLGQGRWEAALAGDTTWTLARVQDRIELERMEPGSRAALGDTAFERRADSLAARIGRVARPNAGRRIVAVIGSSQLFPLAERLATDDHLTLLDARNYLPSQSDVSTATTPEVRLQLVGFMVDRWLIDPEQLQSRLARADSLLQPLAAEAGLAGTVEYYRARIEYLRSDRAGAARRLDGLIASGDATVLPDIPNSEWSWPPWDRLDWKAKFVRATLYDLEADHESAVQTYRELAASLPPNRLRPRFRGPEAFYDLAWYLDDLIETPYRGGIAESLRAQAALRCWPAPGMPDDAWPR